MRQYKDSGIEWIGNIPESWDVKRLKEIFVERNNRDAKGKTLLSVSQYYGIKPKAETDIADSHIAESYDDYKVVQKGDFVMNIMLAWNGSYAVSDYEGIVSPAYCVYQFRKECCHKYLHYLLRTDGYQTAFKTMSRGIIDSRLRLYPEQFYTFNTIFPPVNVQQRIADYLDDKCSQIDSLISLQEQMIKKLKAYKQSVITEAVTKGLNPNAKLVPSGIDWIGEIPEGWKVMRIKNVTSNYKAGPFGSALITGNLLHEGKILVYTPEHVADYSKIFHNTNNLFLQEERRIEMSQFFVKEGDIVFPIVGSLGRAIVIEEKMPEGTILVAEVKDANLASLKVFERLGYVKLCNSNSGVIKYRKCVVYTGGGHTSV